MNQPEVSLGYLHFHVPPKPFSALLNKERSQELFNLMLSGSGRKPHNKCTMFMSLSFELPTDPDLAIFNHHDQSFPQANC